MPIQTETPSSLGPVLPQAAGPAVRKAHALLASLGEFIEVNSQKRSGVPVLKGTRFTVSQLLAEIADGRDIAEIAEDFELDHKLIENLLHGLAKCFDRPDFQ